MNDAQVTELLYQALETEIGGQAVYKAAIRCAQNPDLVTSPTIRVTTSTG